MKKTLNFKLTRISSVFFCLAFMVLIAMGGIIVYDVITYNDSAKMTLTGYIVMRIVEFGIPAIILIVLGIVFLFKEKKRNEGQEGKENQE